MTKRQTSLKTSSSSFSRRRFLFPAALRRIAAVTFLMAVTSLSGFAQITVSVNYGDVINTTASPLLFGGSNEPNPGDQASFYPQATAAGVKFQRGSVHVDQVVPSDTTESAFLSAMTGGSGGTYVSGSVADPSTWNWGPTTWASNAHAQGWTTMANTLYAPAWLTYNAAVNGVPTNWTVWQYIVKAIVVHLGDNLNYIELLNEPTNFVSLTGSPYTTLASAVQSYYYNGAVAARAANSNLQIGGCGDAPGTTADVDALIEDSSLSATLLQFVSIHSYNSNAAGAYSLSSLESTASSYGRANLPVFLTEWNYTYSSNTSSPQVVGNEVVTWMSSQLILLSTQPQLTGADYFSFLPDN